MADRRYAMETHSHRPPSSDGHFSFAPSPPSHSRQEHHASPRRVSRVRMFCPTCGFESFLQRSNDEARCLKCDTLLRRRSAPEKNSTVNAAHIGELQIHRLSDEVKTYEQLLLGEWESGICHQSPHGTHHWKFGKCHYCQRAEGQIMHESITTHDPTGDTWCAMGGKCSFKSASCSKCGRVKGLSNERRHSRRSTSLSLQPDSRRDSLTFQPGPSRELRSTLDTSGRFGRNCPTCGYRCFPWLNDEEKCLNCEAHFGKGSSYRNDTNNGDGCALAVCANNLPRGTNTPCVSRGHSKTPEHVGDDEGCASVPVGGSLRAIRKLQRGLGKCDSDDENQSTSAGSDHEEPMVSSSSNESRVQF